MQLIKIEKKTKGKIEQAKTLLSIFCLLSGIHLSDADLTVLAYFMVYQVTDETKDLILSSEILKSEDSLKNTISRLKKFGLLSKSVVSKQYTLNDRINIQPENLVGMLIKIDNQ